MDNNIDKIKKMIDSKKGSIKVSFEFKDEKQEMMERIKEGVSHILNDSDYKKYLDSIGHFYMTKYSFLNTLMLYMQKQDATIVMGYEKWKEYGRQVQAGEKALYIYAPVMMSEKVKGVAFEAIKDTLVRLKNNNPEQEPVYRIRRSSVHIKLLHNNTWQISNAGKIIGTQWTDKEIKEYFSKNIVDHLCIDYRAVPVFDLSSVSADVPYLFVNRSSCQEQEIVKDNNGEPITNYKKQVQIVNSEERRNRLKLQYGIDIASDMAVKTEHSEAELSILLEALEQLSDENQVLVAYEDLSGKGCLGYYSRGDEKIVVEQGLSVKNKVSVLLHEIAHSELHFDIKNAEVVQSELTGEPISLTKEMKEIQAESVAYMVAGCFGLQTETKSFQYLANYSKDDKMDEFVKCMNVVWNERNELLDKIEDKLKIMGYTKELNPISEKVEKKQTQSVSNAARERTKKVK